MIIFLFFLQAFQLRFNITTPEGNPSESITLQTYQTLKLKSDFGAFVITQEIINLQITTNAVYQINNSCIIQLMNRQADDLNLFINVSNQTDDSILKKIQFSAEIITPSRGNLAQPNLFTFVLSQKLIESYMMPFNLPTNQIYTLDVINQDIGTAPQNQTPFGQEFWQEYVDNNDITLIALPWIPFIGNCRDQGYYLHLYTLLENSTFCNLVPEDETKVVNMIPTSGLNAKGDSCNINLECYYLENLQIEYEGNKWWQSESETLFYISKNALNYKFLSENSDDSLSNYFYNIIQAQEESLVSVIFSTAGAIKNSYPTKFTFKILYNQISSTEKQIVTATITASDYQKLESSVNKYDFNIIYRPMNYLELINSFQFDITLYLVLYIVIGILITIGVFLIWFINKSLSLIQEPPKLRIYQTFIIAFIPPIMGVIRATIPIVIYVLILDNLFATSLFSGLSFNYDGLSTDSDLEQQLERGRVGLMLLVSGIIIMKIACKLCIPKPNDEEWLLIRQSNEKQSEEKYFDFSISQNVSRTSLVKQDEIKEYQAVPKNIENIIQSNSISRQESLFSKQPPPAIAIPGSAPPIVKESQTIIPKNSLFKRATILKQASSIKDNQSLKDPISPAQLLPRQNSVAPLEKKPFSIENTQQFSNLHQQQQQQHEQEEEDIVDVLKDSLISKDYHYQLICILIAALLLFFLGFSYEQLFYKNIYYFLIVLQFIESIVYWLLSEKLLQEQTLIQPLMACIEVVQFIMFMAAESLQEFVISFVIRLTLIIVFRTYINPVIRNFKHFQKKLIKLINKWQPIFNQNEENEAQQDDNISFYLGQHTDAKFTEDQSVEYVIQMTLSFSSKTHAIFIKPIVLVFIKIFEKESQIPNNYYIGFREFNYYIYFAFFVIIPQIFIDICVLNSLEMIYGFKLFDYFDYCKYRNDFRTQKFFEHSLNHDRSIQAQYRSIDNMKFTDQFYYNGSLVIYSIILCLLGTTIIIRNNYLLYSDPAIFLIILFLYIFITLIQNVMLYIWNKIDVWKIKDTKQKIKLDSLEEFLNPAKENIEQIIEVDAFKKQFIELNKDWLVNNLQLFINSESFTQHDEFLLQTYQLLLNDERKAQKEIIRNEQLIKKQKEMELKSKKKKRKTSQSQSMIKSQRDIDEIDGYQHTVRIKRSQVETLRKMLSIWYYKAKQIIFLKYLVADVLAQNQAEHCKRCGLDIELRVVELIPFEKMSNQFKYRILGTPFNKFEWIKYYETHQKFVTLCIDCENAYRSRFLQRQNQSANDVAKLATQNFVAKAFVFKWLFAARSRMLHTTQLEHK